MRKLALPASKRTGSLAPGAPWPDGTPRFRGRVRLGDGTKSSPFEVPHGLNEGQARAYVASIQAQEDAHGGLLAKKAEALRTRAVDEHRAHDLETCDEWHARFLPTLECGDRHRRITACSWAKWISPVIGEKPIRELTRDDVEDVRDKLDRALDAKQIRHSTARNVWGALTGALKGACSSRDRSLRVHTTPLHFGVLPPKRGTSRQRPWLYPNEWARLAACDAVPFDLRQVYAVALYTGLRPGELRALTWGDLDLEARTLSVSKSYDKETHKTKPPKTASGQRIVPLHEHLVPVLRAMRGQAPPSALVVPDLLSGNEWRFAENFRSHLRAAGVTRARLSADNETEEPIDFRSLRDSYATWLALLGTPDKVIQRRMGHASALTTDRYIKAAESLDPGAIGAPFPGLWPERWPESRPLASDSASLRAPTAGLEATRSDSSSLRSPTIAHLEDAKGRDASRYPPDPAASGRGSGQNEDAVEASLARALDLAAQAGRFDVVAQLAKELEARRLAATSNVVRLEAAKRTAGREKP